MVKRRIDGGKKSLPVLKSPAISTGEVENKHGFRKKVFRPPFKMAQKVERKSLQNISSRTCTGRILQGGKKEKSLTFSHERLRYDEK